jgi:hypothetical protein
MNFTAISMGKNIVIALSETKQPLLVVIGPVISNSGQFCCNYLLIGLKSSDIISSICTSIMEHHLFMYFASRSNVGNILLVRDKLGLFVHCE